MCLIVKNQKAFKSARFKNRIYSYDKTDPLNLKLPPFIEDIKDKTLYELIPVLVEKYKQLDYKLKTRDELEEEKLWSDLEIVYLIKFYKNKWSFIIPDEMEFFPSFVFTYNLNPLKLEMDKIISHLQDKLNIEHTSEQLSQLYTYSSLEVTYILHYFAMLHPEYVEEEK